MNNGRGDAEGGSQSDHRLDQLQDLLENFLAASVADRQATNEQMERERQSTNERFRQIESDRERDRIESNRRMTRLEQSMEQFQALVETSYEPVQALLEASTGYDAILASHEEILASHQAMISRLDAILERMVYREGCQEPDLNW